MCLSFLTLGHFKGITFQVWKDILEETKAKTRVQIGFWVKLSLVVLGQFADTTWLKERYWHSSKTCLYSVQNTVSVHINNSTSETPF